MHGAMGVIAYRILPLFGKMDKLGRIRHELPGDGIVRIADVDQFGNRWRDSQCVTLRDRPQAVECAGFDQPCFQQCPRCLDGCLLYTSPSPRDS